jgi:hypothetical protein
MGLSPNTYSFKVTDANGCYYIESYTVAPVTNITVVGTKLADVNVTVIVREAHDSRLVILLRPLLIVTLLMV